MRGRTIRTPEKEERFLEHLAKTASVTAACKSAGIGRASAYEWKAEDAEFSKAWDTAVKLGTAALEDEAVRRGHKGTLKPVYQGGRKVGSVREFSDTLLIFLLKARDPKFRDRVAAELTGANGGPIQSADVSTMTSAEKAAAVARGLVIHFKGKDLPPEVAAALLAAQAGKPAAEGGGDGGQG